MSTSPSRVEQGQPSSADTAEPITEEKLFTKAIEAKLPHPIKSDVNSWIALAQTIAVTSALFAGVQISLNQIVESATFGSTNGPQGHPLPVWYGLRWFMYGAVIINLGCAGSAVAVINMAASLECDIGYMAMRYHLYLREGTAKNKREQDELEGYKRVYEWVTTGKLTTGNFFNHKSDVRRLKQFGIGDWFGRITGAMTLTFIAGAAFIFLTFLYWVALTQVTAAIVMVAVVVTLALLLTLSFLMY